MVGAVLPDVRKAFAVARQARPARGQVLCAARRTTLCLSSSGEVTSTAESWSWDARENDALDEAGQNGTELKFKHLPSSTTVQQAAEEEDSLLEKSPEQQFPHRWKVVGAMIAAFVLCNMDKVNMSVAVIPMAQELGWTATDRGLVSAAFFWGYSLTQMPAGYIATKIGGAKVLLFGVVLWSLGTLVAPPLAHLGLTWLCLSRVIVGLGEGFAPSAVTNIMAKLIPEAERSRAVSLVFGGLDVGSVVGLLLCGPLISAYGWPSVFTIFGVLGLFWAALWPLVRPEQVDDVMLRESSRLEALERVIRSTSSSPDSDAPAPVPYGKFFATPAVWAIITAHFCFNYGYYTLLAWLPSYFELALGVTVAKSSLLALIPYLAMVFMTPVVGPVADGLVQRGWSLTNVRKLCQGISFVGPGICMVALAVLTPAAGVTASPALISQVLVLMTVAFGLSAWARAGLYCNHQDMSPKYASALLGISNTAGALPGVLGVTAVGYILDQTGSWALAVFVPTALVQLFGTIVYTTFASSVRRHDWR